MKSSLRDEDGIPRSDTCAGLFWLSSVSVVSSFSSVTDAVADAKY